MFRNGICTLIVMSIVLGLIGCSSQGSNPVLPVGGETDPGIVPSESIETPLAERELESERVLWGVWTIHPDFKEMKLVVEPLRNLQAHYNITNMIVPPACDDCFSVSVNSFDPITRILDADITLKNPTPIAGKDVRGILHTNEKGHLLTNADSWTGYWDAPGGDDINPFIAFAKDQPNRTFAGNSEDTQNFLIYIPIPPAYPSITFAVDGSYPGNCKEPYEIGTFVQEGDLNPVAGSMCGITVDVLDWQDDVDVVDISVPGITGVELLGMAYNSGNEWSATLVNNNGAGSGEYDAKIIATSANSGSTELYQMVKIRIKETEDPIVTHFEPSTAFLNENIEGASIDGSNFLGPCVVTLTGGDSTVISTYNVDVLSSINITCDFDVPSDAELGLYNVVVVNADEKAGIGLDVITITCPDPVVQTIDPNTANAAENLTGITITGSNFMGPEAIVALVSEGEPGILALNVNIDSLTQITCDLLIPPDAALGLYDVEVRNGCGSVGIGPEMFEVLCPVPVIDTVDPGTAEVGETLLDVVVTGSNFIGPDVAVWIYMDGNPVIPSFDVQVLDENTLNVDFIIPPETNPGLWSLEVENTCLEIGTAFDVFEITPPPQNGWAQTWGGTDEDKGYAVACDDSGYSYIAGSFKGTADFDPTDGVMEFDSQGSTDAFLCKYNPQGLPEWVRVWGGTGGDVAYDVAIGDGGYVYVTGYFSETVEFDPGNPAGNRTSEGSLDAYVLKLTPNGDVDDILAWGSTDGDVGYALILDDLNHLYVTGVFTGTVDFNPDPDETDDHDGNGGNDVFLTKFPAGGGYGWTRTWGAGYNDVGLDVAADSDWNVYVSGHFKGTVDFDPHPVNVDSHEAIFNAGGFVTKFDGEGNHLWADSWVEFYDIHCTGVTNAGSNDVYVTGFYQWEGIDLDPGVGVDDHPTIGNKDMFLIKLDSDGAYAWGMHFGGTVEDIPYRIESNSLGDIFITGFFETSADLDPDDVDEDIHTGFGDQVYLSKFDTSGEYIWGKSWGLGGDDHGRGVATNSYGDIWVTGYFRGEVDFNPDPVDEDLHKSKGLEDISLSKFLPDGTW